MKAITIAITGLALILAFWGIVFLAVITEVAPNYVGIYAFATPDTWNWGEIIKATTGLWTAYIATLALQNWKRQSNAQKKTEFMDSLTDATHEYIELISSPVEFLKYIQIAIDAHSKDNPSPEDRLKGAIAFIEKDGEEDSKKLWGYLEKCTPALAKLRSLEAKGQVFGFKDYPTCQNACRMLQWQHERLLGLCYMIGRKGLNWENQKIQQTLSKMISLDPGEIENSIKTENGKLLEFFKTTYADLYK